MHWLMAGGVRKGAWSGEEDSLLRKCLAKYGEGKWHQVPLRAGLNRCRKSCRLRWLNYLRPNIKRGSFSLEEVDLIVRLHKLLGNSKITIPQHLLLPKPLCKPRKTSPSPNPKTLSSRWSLIAGRLPGRTANDVKNYWNTHQTKKCKSKHESDFSTIKPTTTQSQVLKPRPRTFIRPGIIASLYSRVDILTPIPVNNNEDDSIEKMSSVENVTHEAMTLFNNGMFQNVDYEAGGSWPFQLSVDEEEMVNRFWLEEIPTCLVEGNNEGDGDGNNKDKNKTSTTWDNNNDNGTATDMDIWDLFGYS